MRVSFGSKAYQALVIGSAMPKRTRAAFDVADLADDGAVADDEATPTKEGRKGGRKEGKEAGRGEERRWKEWKARNQ